MSVESAARQLIEEGARQLDAGETIDVDDALPATIYMSVPEAWRTRRLRVPAGVHLHHADVDEEDREWFGAVPVTAPVRTLRDCAEAEVAPDLIRDALQDGLVRGLFGDDEVSVVEAHLIYRGWAETCAVGEW